MPSARVQCPQCASIDIVDYGDLIFSMVVDYLHCNQCGCWWQLPKESDEPVTYLVAGKAG